MTVGILLLAGGSSARMRGPDKVVEEVRGLPLLADRAVMCLKTNALQVIVVTDPEKPDRRRALDGLDVQIIDNEGAYLGMAHSLKLGIGHITADAVVIMLADMPDLTFEDLNRMISVARTSNATILRGATENGTAGHPVLIKRKHFHELDDLQGDKGAAPVLAKHRDQIELVALPNEHAMTDLDTPEAWEKWRAKT